MTDTQPPKTVPGLRIDRTPVDLDVARLEWRPAAYAVILNHQGHLLVMDNQWNGRKHIPGGGIEVWESSTAALTREVWEETGLEVEIGELVHADEGFHLTPGGSQWHTIQLYYRARVIGGDLRDSILEGEATINPHWLDPATLGPDGLTLGWQALRKALEHH